MNYAAPRSPLFSLSNETSECRPRTCYLAAIQSDKATRDNVRARVCVCVWSKTTVRARETLINVTGEPRDIIAKLEVRHHHWSFETPGPLRSNYSSNRLRDSQICSYNELDARAGL